MNFSEALGEALSFVEDEVSKFMMQNLEVNAARLAKDITESYDQFFAKLKYYVLESGVYAGEPGAPVILQMVKASPWKADSDSWMQRKDQAFGEGDDSALDFYRGVTTALGAGKRKPKVSLHAYISKLASTKGSTERFFGDIELIFIETQPDGRERVLRNSSDLTKHLNITQGRDARGRFTSFLRGTTLRAEIRAFTKIEKVLASQDAPDMQLDAFLATQDKANAKQWVKFSGQKEWHRPAVIPMIQWYLEVEFQRLINKHLFFGD